MVYLALFRTFGFHALPFKILLFTALALTCFLSEDCAETVGSLPAASWALLLCCYHAAMNGLYLNSERFTMFSGIRVSFWRPPRVHRRYFTASRRSLPGLFIVLGLYIAGLCCKEMVVTLPVVMLAYSVILSGSITIERLRWPFRSGLPVIACSIVAAVYTLGKMAGPDLLTADAAYTPHFTFGHSNPDGALHA